MTQHEFMEQIQDEIVYIIECLLQDYTGEAKSEVNSLINSIKAMEGLDSGYCKYLTAALEKILSDLRHDNQSYSARSDLIKLRQKVTNTRLQLLGRPLKYNYADVLVAKDE